MLVSRILLLVIFYFSFIDWAMQISFDVKFGPGDYYCHTEINVCLGWVRMLNLPGSIWRSIWTNLEHAGGILATVAIKVTVMVVIMLAMMSS